MCGSSPADAVFEEGSIRQNMKQNSGPTRELGDDFDAFEDRLVELLSQQDI
jgi:hypothetical protein